MKLMRFSYLVYSLGNYVIELYIKTDLSISNELPRPTTYPIFR